MGQPVSGKSPCIAHAGTLLAGMQAPTLGLSAEQRALLSLVNLPVAVSTVAQHGPALDIHDTLKPTLPALAYAIDQRVDSSV